MKKRILSAFLALVLLVSLAPAAAFTASAASLSVSESAITVLKRLVGYSKTCYQSGSKYYIGYGTLCDNEDHTTLSVTASTTSTDGTAEYETNDTEHTITETEADVLLRAELATICTSVNSFASSAGLSLSQSKFDALVLYSFCSGTAWMSGTGVFRTAVVNGVSGNSFLNTCVNACTSSNVVSSYGLQIANMYMNGNYSATAPSTFKIMKFDADGGYLAESGSGSYKCYYDTSLTDTDLPTPTYTGKTFAGWYTEEDGGGTKITKLNYAASSYTTLYAYWSDSASTTTDDDSIDVTVTVTNSYVNIREYYNIYSTKIGTYSYGEELRIVDAVTGSDGFLWGAVATSGTDDTVVGWIALMYTDWSTASESSSSSSSALATAVISCSNYVNVRAGAGTGYKVTGALANGTKVYIYEFETVSGLQWGRTDVGWICLSYAEVTMLGSNTVVSTDPTLASYAFTGVTKDATPVFSSSDTGVGDVVTTLAAGTEVTVLQLKGSSLLWEEALWGYTSSGWVKLKYLDLDESTFVVTSSSLTVRDANGSESTVSDVLSTGVELVIDSNTLCLSWDGTKTSVWGYTEKYDGYVNLSSSSVDRTNAPDIDEDDDTTEYTGLIATVINTDTVNVRRNPKTTSTLIGTLSRGTTVPVLDEEDGWYQLDIDVDDDPDTNSWVYGGYLEVYEGTITTSSSSSSSTSSSSETGTGIIANTYTGVNLRSGPSTAYASLGKILTGTEVTILEVTTTGTTKWGRVEGGWICMDYVTMISYDDIPGYSSSSSSSTSTSVSSYDDVETSSTTAIYTGYVNKAVKVRKSAEDDAEAVTSLSTGDSVTIHELLAVTTTKTGSTTDSNGDTVTVTTETVTYWARVNDGYIQNPEDYITLYTLDEETYTLTAKDSLNVYTTEGGSTVAYELTLGDQVTVTALQIIQDKVWGKVANEDGAVGWARLDYFAEGAYTLSTSTSSTTSTTGTSTTTTTTDTSSTKYTGTVINTTSLNVRATASTSATITTTLSQGAALVIYETTISEGLAWGRCDAGWVYLYYVDLSPSSGTAIDAKIVLGDAGTTTTIYASSSGSETVGTYARMTVVNIYEVVGTRSRTDDGWVETTRLGN